MSIMEYYDANAVAEESYIERYCSCEDEPTLCDCGETAEEGFPYCRMHLNELDFIMLNTKKYMQESGFSEEDAELAMVYWLEHTGEFEERRNGNTENNTKRA